jgi:hypothetical protein
MTSNVVSMDRHLNGLPRTLSIEACRKLLDELLDESGRVLFTDHAYDRMEEREITSKQVYVVLRRGEFVEDPAWTSHHNWAFTLRDDTAGQIVTVRAAIDVDSLTGLAVLVITAF